MFPAIIHIINIPTSFTTTFTTTTTITLLITISQLTTMYLLHTRPFAQPLTWILIDFQ